MLTAGHCQPHPALASLMASRALAVDDSIKGYYPDPGGTGRCFNLDVPQHILHGTGKTKKPGVWIPESVKQGG